MVCIALRGSFLPGVVSVALCCLVLVVLFCYGVPVSVFVFCVASLCCVVLFCVAVSCFVLICYGLVGCVAFAVDLV